MPAVGSRAAHLSTETLHPEGLTEYWTPPRQNPPNPNRTDTSHGISTDVVCLSNNHSVEQQTLLGTQTPSSWDLRSGWHLCSVEFLQHFPLLTLLPFKAEQFPSKTIQAWQKMSKKCFEKPLFSQLQVFSLQNAHMAQTKRAELEYKELLMVKHSENATESKSCLVTSNIWSIKNSPVQMMKQFIKKWM